MGLQNSDIAQTGSLFNPACLDIAAGDMQYSALLRMAYLHIPADNRPTLDCGCSALDICTSAAGYIALGTFDLLEEAPVSATPRHATDELHCMHCIDTMHS